MATLTLARSIEQTVAGAVEWGVSLYRLLRDEIGEQPLGYSHANRWERLSAYLTDLRDNPLAWQQLLDFYTARFFGNLRAATEKVCAEAAFYERSLALEGGWDRTPEDYVRAVQLGAARVQAEMFARRVHPALLAQRQVEREAAKPAALISPPLFSGPYQPPYLALLSEGPTPAPPPPTFPPPGEPLVQQLGNPGGVYVG